jgi:hypothetical protein
MTAIDPDNATDADGPAENRNSPPTGERENVTDRLTRARRLLATAGVLAGLLAFGVGEAIYELIPAEIGTVRTMGNIIAAPTPETISTAEIRNGALTFGAFGMCLGACLGIAGGRTRRSASATVLAGCLGSALGLTAGVGVSLVSLPFFLKIQPDHLEYEVIISVFMHASVWGSIGAAAGLAFAVGMREPAMFVRALAGGFVGALLGTIAFDLIGGALFPLANTALPISTSWPTRLMARLLVSIATATFLILSLGTPRAHDFARNAPSTPAR